MPPINLSVFFENYTKEIGFYNYSLIIISEFERTKIYTNNSKYWAKEFLSKKMDTNSDIIKKAKTKIAPFKWSINDITDGNLVKISKLFNINEAMTFILNYKFDLILYTIYSNSESFDANTNNIKHKIQFDLISFFEERVGNKNKINLSNREKNVIDLLKIGKKYDEISNTLGIKERTVRFHISNILDKLEVNSVRYAIFKATKLGII